MSLFFVIVLTVAAFGLVAYPLLKQKPAPTESPDDGPLQDLQSRRDTTYSMLKELEFDYESGLLAEDDYHDLEARYKEKAVSILKSMDQSEQGADDEGEIEQQVRRLRRPGPARRGAGASQGSASSAEDQIEEQVRRLRKKARHPAAAAADLQAPVPQVQAGPGDTASGEVEEQARKPRMKQRFCTQCGAQMQSGDRFCGSCGARLDGGGNR